MLTLMPVSNEPSKIPIYLPESRQFWMPGISPSVADDNMSFISEQLGNHTSCCRTCSYDMQCTIVRILRVTTKFQHVEMIRNRCAHNFRVRDTCKLLAASPAPGQRWH